MSCQLKKKKKKKEKSSIYLWTQLLFDGQWPQDINHTRYVSRIQRVQWHLPLGRNHTIYLLCFTNNIYIYYVV